jgi:hypothetical protein
VIAHPLVLSLALPGNNPLAAREGIKWKDAVGPVLAARVTAPAPRYRSPEYEKALFKYYRGLWDKYPYEMLALYIQKFSMVSSHARSWMMRNYHDKYWPGAYLAPVYKAACAIMPVHIIYPCLLTAALALCLFLPNRLRVNLILLHGQIIAAGLAAYGESGIIYPYFKPTTNHPNAFFMIYFSLTLMGVALTGAAYILKSRPKFLKSLYLRRRSADT